MFRKWLIFGGIVTALAAAGAFLLFGRSSSPSVPDDFTEARTHGAEIARIINGFADSAVDNLGEIAKQDEAKDYTKALDLTLEEIKQIRESKEKSFELLNELQKMTAAIDRIKSDDLQQTAMQAVSTEIALVAKLIEYNDDLNQLLDNLSAKFSSYTPDFYDNDTNEITGRMNTRALEINELSRKYQSFMKEFDEEAEGNNR